MNNNKAFTLIEILIVVAILGAIAMIGAPMYMAHLESSSQKSACAYTFNLVKSIQTWVNTQGFKPTEDNNEDWFYPKLISSGTPPSDTWKVPKDSPNYILRPLVGGTNPTWDTKIYSYKIGPNDCHVFLWAEFDNSVNRLKIYLYPDSSFKANGCVNKLVKDPDDYASQINEFIKLSGLDGCKNTCT